MNYSLPCRNCYWRMRTNECGGSTVVAVRRDHPTSGALLQTQSSGRSPGRDSRGYLVPVLDAQCQNWLGSACLALHSAMRTLATEADVHEVRYGDRERTARYDPRLQLFANRPEREEAKND